MVKKVVKPGNLLAYVELLQTRGRLTFTAKEAIASLKVSKIAFQRSAGRLMSKRRLIHPVRGFYVIVPIENRNTGAPNPLWFIDNLMKFKAQPYYVGLLSAAALHGATHQAVQELQIVTNSQMRLIEGEKYRIRFLVNKRMQRVPSQPIKTPSGFIPVATPETTAFDLVYYLRWAGALNNVATILTELAEKLNPDKLVTVAKIYNEVGLAQRLGFILDQVANVKLTKNLHEWVKNLSPSLILLQPGKGSAESQKNKKWCIAINETMESDL